MLLLFSILACCSYSQFLHAALIHNSCMLLLFSIPACCSYSQFLHAAFILNSACWSYSQLLLLLYVNSFTQYNSISAPLVLKFCCSCFVNPDFIIFKNPAALILLKKPAALVTNATCPLLKFWALILNSYCSYSALFLSISVLLFLI
jgi:hypothetical protein